MEFIFIFSGNALGETNQILLRLSRSNVGIRQFLDELAPSIVRIVDTLDDG
jgi:hypothetical protein